MSQEKRYNEIAFPSRLVSHPANPPSVDSVPSDPLCAMAGPLDGFSPNWTVGSTRHECSEDAGLALRARLRAIRHRDYSGGYGRIQRIGSEAKHYHSIRSEDRSICERAPIPSGGGVVRSVAATADGRVYIACSGVDQVGVVEPVR